MLSIKTVLIDAMEQLASMACESRARGAFDSDEIERLRTELLGCLQRLSLLGLQHLPIIDAGKPTIQGVCIQHRPLHVAVVDDEKGVHNVDTLGDAKDSDSIQVSADDSYSVIICDFRTWILPRPPQVERTCSGRNPAGR